MATTDRMSDIANIIYDIVDKQPAIISYNIANSLQRVSPKLSNALANSWQYGPTLSGHVLGKGLSEFENHYISKKTKEKTSSFVKQDYRPLKPIKKKVYKKRTLHMTFMVWNNTPYLNWRNDGYVFGRLTGANRNFIQDGIATGESIALAAINYIPKP